jgi:BlaI family transcriptional regulator, penicillinase repressor
MRGCFLAQDLTPSEREVDILKVLWKLGSASVGRVHRCLCPNEELAFNTVQTVLRIMEEKGFVQHHAEGRTFIYKPCYSREQVAVRFLNKVFDGDLDQLVRSVLASKSHKRAER